VSTGILTMNPRAASEASTQASMASRKASACAKHGDHDGRLLLIVDRILHGTLGFGLGIGSVIVRIDGDFAGALLLGIIASAGLSQFLRRAQVPTTQLGSFGSGQADRNS